MLGFPAYVKVLINDKTKQIAVTPTTAKADNAIKFSKPEGKQAASVSVKEATLIEAVKAYFTLRLRKAKSPTSPSTVPPTPKARP